MKLIGTGTFTKAYLLDDGKTVQLKTSDPIKECMAEGWFSSHRLFPVINLSDNREVYTMEYYPKVNSLKNNLTNRQYRLYSALRKLSIDYNLKDWEMTEAWYDQFDSLPNEFKEEKEALKESFDGARNYTSNPRFEISPRNVSVKGGKLVLLDTIFCADALKRTRTTKY